MAEASRERERGWQQREARQPAKADKSELAKRYSPRMSTKHKDDKASQVEPQICHTNNLATGSLPPLHLTATQYTSYTHTHSRHTHTHTEGRSVQQLFSPLRERLNICPEMETLSSSSTLESSWSRKQQQAAAGGIRTTLTHNCVVRRSVKGRGGWAKCSVKWRPKVSIQSAWQLEKLFRLPQQQQLRLAPSPLHCLPLQLCYCYSFSHSHSFSCCCCCSRAKCATETKSSQWLASGLLESFGCFSLVNWVCATLCVCVSLQIVV